MRETDSQTVRQTHGTHTECLCGALRETLCAGHTVACAVRARETADLGSSL